MAAHPGLGEPAVLSVACRTFLPFNGHDLEAPKEERYRTFLGFAAEEALTAWLRERPVVVNPPS